MRVIRHQIGIVDHQIITLPNHGELLSVARSRTEPDLAIDLWSLDQQEGAPQKIALFIVGTGNPIEGVAAEAVYWGKFLGTVVTPSRLVWHVWQGKIA